MTQLGPAWIKAIQAKQISIRFSYFIYSIGIRYKPTLLWFKNAAHLALLELINKRNLQACDI